MMMKRGFRTLEVWKRARDLAVLIYGVTAGKPYSIDSALRDQLRRAAVSIPSNIAEGDERGTNRESVRFFYIAKGSLAELVTQLEISKAVAFINAEDFEMLLNECENIGRMLGQLIKIRSKT